MVRARLPFVCLDSVVQSLWLSHNDSGDDLLGLWGSEVTLGPQVRGEVLLQRAGAMWSLRVGGFEVHGAASGEYALMNARGLMELIIINIGLQRGVIEPGLFAILVVMAIVTTLMASPLFEAVYGRRARTEGKLA